MTLRRCINIGVNCMEERGGHQQIAGEYEQQLYAVELLSESGEGVEQVLAREDRADVARMLYEVMQGQFPDRVIVLRVGDTVLDRSDR
jgi:hypothetical protein